MRAAFRVDASSLIGSGHVMRCLTLADALREPGVECRFVCREHDGNMIGLIGRRGHAAIGLPLHEATRAKDHSLAHSSWLGADWQTDAQQTLAALADERVDLLIVDHYALDLRWERQLRTACSRLMVIDDIADRQHDCDLLLDQNLIENLLQRYEGKVPEHCGQMLGPQFALLRPMYAELNSRVPARAGAIQRVLIYFGAADGGNLTGMALAACLSLQRPDIAVDVVINSAGPHTESIRRQAEGHAHVTLHAELPSLAPLMVKADLAIGAGGATSWERCCLGLPSLVVTLAENQVPIATELHRRGLIVYLGRQEAIDAGVVASALASIVQSGLAPEWSERCRVAVDGRGAERVSAILTLDARTPLQARLARLDDETLILQWANDPLVRRNAFHQGSIDPATHRAWFHRRLRDIEGCRLYIVETSAGLPIGQVRFQNEGAAWEIHYSLDPRARGRGLAKPMLKSAMAALGARHIEAPIFGRVKPANQASRQVFEGLGFEAEQHGDEIVYRRSLQSQE